MKFLWCQQFVVFRIETFCNLNVLFVQNSVYFWSTFVNQIKRIRILRKMKKIKKMKNFPKIIGYPKFCFHSTYFLCVNLMNKYLCATVFTVFLIAIALLCISYPSRHWLFFQYHTHIVWCHFGVPLWPRTYWEHQHSYITH